MTSLGSNLTPNDTDLDRLFQSVLLETRRLPPCNALESVEFKIGLSEDYPWTVVHEHWLPLATNFTRDTFPHLKEVTVDVYTWAPRDWCSDEEISAGSLGEVPQDLLHPQPIYDLSKISFDDLDLHFAFVFSPDGIKF